MRILLLLVLLANLVVFGAVQGWYGDAVRAAIVPEQREASRAAQQVRPELVEVLAPGAASAPAPAEAAPGGLGAAAAASNPGAANANTNTAAPAGNTNVAVAGTSAVCLELVGLTTDDAKRVADTVTASHLANLVAVRPAPEAMTYMVYLPAQASKAAADKLAANLRDKGVDDILVIQDTGEMRNAISLGVFRSAELAANRVADLALRGFKGARISARPSNVSRQRVEAREVREDSRPKLDQLAREFPGLEWHECPAAASSKAEARKG